MADNLHSLIDNFHKEKDGRANVHILEKGDEQLQHRPQQSDPHDVMQTADSTETRVSDERMKSAETMHGTDEWLHKQALDGNNKQ